MKKTALLYALLIFLMIPSIALTTYAHQGRTDSSGGHTDHSTGEYHYHHGYPAHDHYDIDGDGDIDCPYDFDDQTAGSSETTEPGKGSLETVFIGIIAVAVYVFIMFVLPFLIS